MSGTRPAAGQAPAAAGEPGRPARPAQHRSRWKAVFFLLAVTGLVVGLAWALLDSRFLIVRSVRVIGTGRLVSRAQVTAAAGIQRGLPLVRINTAAVARQVERIRQVQSAQVSLNWPNGVTITVRERRPVFAVPDGGGYDLVDPFGVVVSRAAARPPAMPRLSFGPPGTVLRGDPAVRAAAAVLHELPGRIARQVRVVSAASPDDVTVRLADGVTIVWGGPQRAAQKARELAVLMRAHARRYDVSAPGTAMTQG